MKEIILITTEGCEGCAIMRHSIKQALVITRKEDITFKEINHKDFFKENHTLYNKLKLGDFPTTIFKKDDKILRKEVGTRPYIVVLRWIDIDF